MLLLLGRHSESWNNFADTFYSTPAWGNCWPKLNGSGTITWGPDIEVTGGERSCCLEEGIAHQPLHRKSSTQFRPVCYRS